MESAAAGPSQRDLAAALVLANHEIKVLQGSQPDFYHTTRPSQRDLAAALVLANHEIKVLQGSQTFITPPG